MIRAFRPQDVLAIDVQPLQLEEFGPPDLAYGERAARGAAWTATMPNGEGGEQVIGCGGIVPLFASHGLAWALLAGELGARFVAMTRCARAAIEASPYRRIEALVRADWPQAIRWAEAIGLERNALIRAWGPLGIDHVLYERVKPQGDLA